MLHKRFGGNRATAERMEIRATDWQARQCDTRRRRLPARHSSRIRASSKNLCHFGIGDRDEVGRKSYFQ